MKYELKGNVTLIDPVQEFDSGFKKQEFVVTTDEKYPQDVKFECVKDKIDMIEDLDLELDDRVTVSFNIRGNEYKGRYYVNLQAWNIVKEGHQASPKEHPSAPPSDDIEEDVEEEPPF